MGGLLAAISLAYVVELTSIVTVTAIGSLELWAWWRWHPDYYRRGVTVFACDLSYRQESPPKLTARRLEDAVDLEEVDLIETHQMGEAIGFKLPHDGFGFLGRGIVIDEGRGQIAMRCFVPWWPFLLIPFSLVSLLLDPPPPMPMEFPQNTVLLVPVAVLIGWIVACRRIFQRVEAILRNVLEKTPCDSPSHPHSVGRSNRSRLRG